jgi:hypothetical protein
MRTVANTPLSAAARGASSPMARSSAVAALASSSPVGEVPLSATRAARVAGSGSSAPALSRSVRLMIPPSLPLSRVRAGSSGGGSKPTRCT